MKPRFFSTPAAFGEWLEKHHDSAEELLVGFRKVDTGKPSITWPQSVDEALCWGWIDGVRKRIDDESYTISWTCARRASSFRVSFASLRRSRPLLFPAERYDEHVTVRRLRRVDGHHRSHAVIHAAVVDER